MLPLKHSGVSSTRLGDYLLLLILWNWGEPFLHPQICEMIAYASHGASLFTAAQWQRRLSAEKAEQIVASVSAA